MTTHKSISNSAKTSEFQQAIEVVEALEPEAQAILIDIIAKRLKQRQREELVQAVKEAEAEFARGEFRSGSVADLLTEIDNCRD
ncbi:MAG: hypothetical protein LH660_18985 [Phormidesmis sp. CAN_BIN36]|nr:hypothetical protein [Phormidesmis sp. CAN_BIN36]